MSTIKDVIGRLETLDIKITDTWKLLRIDELKEQVAHLEKNMQDPAFWTDPERAGQVSKQRESLVSEIETWETLQKETRDLFLFAQDLVESPDESFEVEVATKTEELENSLFST